MNLAAGSYTFMRCILVCGLYAGLTCCRSCCDGAPTFVHSDKSRQKRILFVKTESSNQREVSFLPTPADGSLKVLFYHRQCVNAFLLSNSFPLPSAWFSKRLPIHVGSSVVLLITNKGVNALRYPISFPLPTCTIIGKKILCGSLVFLHEFCRRLVKLFISVGWCADWV